MQNELSEELFNKVVSVYADELAKRLLSARLRVEEVATILKVHQNTVCSWIEKGWINADRGINGNNRPLIALQDLSRFVEWYGKEKR